MTDAQIITPSVQVPVNIGFPTDRGAPTEESLKILRNHIMLEVDYYLNHWEFLNSTNILNISFDIRTDHISRHVIEIIHLHIYDLIKAHINYK